MSAQQDTLPTKRKTLRSRRLESAAKNKTAVSSSVAAGPGVRISPVSGGVSIWHPALFAVSDDSLLREFLARVFSIEEIAGVEIHRSDAYAKLRYGRSADTATIWRKLSRVLRRSDPVESSALDVPNEYGDLRPLGSDGLYLEEQAPGAAINVSRVGSSLSTWRLNHHSQDRLRLSHPILLKRRDVAYRLEEELASILGVEEARTSSLTSGVAIRFDSRQIDAERLIRQLEKAWPRLLNGLDSPPSPKRLIAAGGLLGLAFTGQYLAPALRPLALLGVTIYGFPNVINGARQLARRQVGLSVLYAAGLALMLVSGMPFSSTVMAVLMQFWPRLAHRTMTISQRRLFAIHRRRATWARLAQEDGLEIQVDIDQLKLGDLIVVDAGEFVPVDGVVTRGLAAVDEEAISGAVGAFDKTPGDKVYAGSFIRDGRLKVRVERIGSDTAAGCIGAHLPRARIDRLPSAAAAERIANRNAKPALAVAGLSLLLTRIARPSQAFIRPDYATAPRFSAQLSALHDLSDGLNKGIFFRDPVALDRSAGANFYVFDDTAALERRQIEVAEVFSSGLLSTKAVLGYAAAAFPALQNERARALHRRAEELRAPIPGIFERVRRAGAIAYRDSDNRLVEIASPAYVAHMRLKAPASIAEAVTASPYSILTAGGAPVSQSDPRMRALWVLRDGDTLGVVAFHEQGPSEAQEVIAALKARNRRARFVYISKHPQALAEAIAGDVGVFTVFGDLDSAGKVDIFRTLGRRTVWIGDGADPEALASIEACAVSVSIAGLSSVPEDAADVVFLQPGLRNLAPFMRLGREHRARLAADYRAVYAANLLGAAGGFVAGFGSLQAGLTSNAGTAYVYAKHWVQLQNLISRVEARRAQILSPTQDGESYEELDYEEIELSLEAAEAKIDQIEQLDDQDFETPAQTGGELDGV